MEPQIVPRKSKKGFYIILWVLSLLITAVVTVLVCMMIFDRPKDDLNNNSSSQVTETKREAAFKEYCAEHERMCFDYPDGWSIESDPWRYNYDGEGDSSAEFDRVTVFSPSRQNKLVLTSGISGIGGMCFPEDAGKVSIVDVKKTVISNFTGGLEDNMPDAYAVSMVTSNKEETEFTPKIGLTRSSEIVNRTADSGCDAMLLGMVDGRSAMLDGDAEHVSYGSVQFVYGHVLGGGGSDGESGEGAKTYASLEKAKKALEDPELKQAFNIISSARYK